MLSCLFAIALSSNVFAAEYTLVSDKSISFNVAPGAFAETISVTFSYENQTGMADADLNPPVSLSYSGHAIQENALSGISTLSNGALYFTKKDYGGSGASAWAKYDIRFTPTKEAIGTAVFDVGLYKTSSDTKFDKYGSFSGTAIVSTPHAKLIANPLTADATINKWSAAYTMPITDPDGTSTGYTYTEHVVPSGSLVKITGDQIEFFSSYEGVQEFQIAVADNDEPGYITVFTATVTFESGTYEYTLVADKEIKFDVAPGAPNETINVTFSFENQTGKPDSWLTSPVSLSYSGHAIQENALSGISSLSNGSLYFSKQGYSGSGPTAWVTYNIRFTPTKEAIGTAVFDVGLYKTSSDTKFDKYGSFSGTAIVSTPHAKLIANPLTADATINKWSAAYTMPITDPDGTSTGYTYTEHVVPSGSLVKITGDQIEFFSSYEGVQEFQIAVADNDEPGYITVFTATVTFESGTYEYTLVADKEIKFDVAPGAPNETINVTFSFENQTGKPDSWLTSPVSLSYSGHAIQENALSGISSLSNGSLYFSKQGYSGSGPTAWVTYNIRFTPTTVMGLDTFDVGLYHTGTDTKYDKYGSLAGEAFVAYPPAPPTLVSDLTIETLEGLTSKGHTPSFLDEYGTRSSYQFDITTQPANGVAEVIGGEIFYTPNSSFIGVDPFSFSVTDLDLPSLPVIGYGSANVGIAETFGTVDDVTFLHTASVVKKSTGDDASILRYIDAGVIKKKSGDTLSGLNTVRFSLSDSAKNPVEVAGITINPGDLADIDVDFTLSAGKLRLPIKTNGAVLGDSNYTLTILAN